MQKYLHLLQIVETEKTVAKQLRQQIEDGEIEIERLKAEVTVPTSCPKPQAPQDWGHMTGQGQLPATAIPAYEPEINDAGRVGKSSVQTGVLILPLPPKTATWGKPPNPSLPPLLTGFSHPTLRAARTQ